MAGAFFKTGLNKALSVLTFIASAVVVSTGRAEVYAAGDCDEADLVHRWSFNGDLRDSVGGAAATVTGASSWDDEAAPTAIALPGGSKGAGEINLGANMLPADGSPVTIEIWATQRAAGNWCRVFDVGANTANYLTLEWENNGAVEEDVCQVKKGGTALVSSIGGVGGFPLGTEWHISMTIVKRDDGRSDLRWMRRDARTGARVKAGSATTSAAWTLADVAANALWLGRSQYNDKDPNAVYNEVRVWKACLSDTQLARNVLLGPDRLPAASAYTLGSVEVAAGAVLEAKTAGVTIGALTGAGRIVGDGMVTVAETLSIGGDAAATLGLDGRLAVAGAWLIAGNGVDGTDRIVGAGTLDLSNAVIALAGGVNVPGELELARVGEVIGWETARVPRGKTLKCEKGVLTLVTPNLVIFVR